MEKNIGVALKDTKTLIHIREELIKLFKTAKKKNGISKIGYVAGIITSDGPKHLKINKKRLADYTRALRKIYKFPVFSAVDVFSGEIYTRLAEMVLSFEKKEVKFRRFWRGILKSGHVTDIFMTPRWDKSKGATDEHKTAKQIGLTIHYIKGEVEKFLQVTH